MVPSRRHDAAARRQVILRAGAESHVEAHLYEVAPELRGTDRAAMAQSVIAGFSLMRKMIGGTALNGADEATLARTLRHVFTLLVRP